MGKFPKFSKALALQLLARQATGPRKARGAIASIWMFPKIVVPPNHPIFIGFSIINHPFLGSPIFGNTHMCRWRKIYVGCYIHRNLKRNVRGQKTKKVLLFFRWFLFFLERLKVWEQFWNHRVDDFLRETVDTMNQLILQHEKVSTWQT